MSDRLQEAASGRAGPKAGFSGWIAGRARRREYWTWAVPWFIATAVVAVVTPGVEVVLGPIMLLAWIRRLHDLGRSGWFAPLFNIVIGIIGWLETGILSPRGTDGEVISPIVALVALIVLGALPGQRTSNAYGPPPGKPQLLAETFS